MTVIELINILKTFPEDCIVWMESCDGCYVKSDNAQLSENTVTIFNTEHDLIMEAEE